jgi:hypothetical protein
MKPSLSLLPLLLAVIVLGGCPDPKIPKVPPQVPAPKAMSAGSTGAAPLDAPVAAPVRRPI